MMQLVLRHPKEQWHNCGVKIAYFHKKIASVNNALGTIAWHTIFYAESYQISVPDDNT
jgi:hypothetical protein